MAAAAAAPASWLAHPLAEALLRFELLPSTWLHPSRAMAHPPPDELQGAPSLHRHWSQALRREHALQPVAALDDPALPLALLPAERFARLVLLAGIALLGPQIRHTIAREPVARLREQLGAEGFDAALEGAGQSKFPPVDAALQVDEARAQCERWGAGLLARAFESAAAAVGQRAMLRLPAECEPQRAHLERSGLAPAQALGLARELTQSLEPAWLSSFPAAR